MTASFSTPDFQVQRWLSYLDAFLFSAAVCLIIYFTVDFIAYWYDAL